MHAHIVYVKIKF